MKASIIIINYNDKRRVCRAIESALAQTWTDKEIIVVDDGSDKETRELYSPYKDKVKFVQLERNDVTARTPSRARNAGIEVATGEYVCFLDSDNYLELTYIESMIKLDADVAFCNWDIIGLENHKINVGRIWDFTKPLIQNYLKFQSLDHQCLLIRKSYLDKCKYYDERLPRSQDCDLIVRLILNGGKWEYIEKTLFFFEKHETDQMKSIASIYGKTLWSLKNNINIQWLLGMVREPNHILSIFRAIEEFKTTDLWKDDYNKSEFKLLLDNFNGLISDELKEK